jgi:hypothetical protein
MAALLLSPSFDQVYLRYSLVVTASEEKFIPGLLLDDWGHEIRELDLYRWIRNNGHQFPRAEVFGHDFDGKERQYFIRDLDLMARYPCYGYADRRSLLSEGQLIEHFLICDEETVIPQRLDTPAVIDWPMRNASVSWWRVSLAAASDFAATLTDF